MEQQQASAPQPANGKRKRFLLIVLAVVVLAAIAWTVWWMTTGRYYESTDDAYVNGNIVQVTPQIAGTVIGVGADETDFVKPGQMLVQFDRTDAKIALDRAESQLARSVRQVRNVFAVDSQLEAMVDERRIDVKRNNDDVARRERAAGSGAVSQEEVEHAREAARSASASLTAAERQLAANRVLVDGTTVHNHPDVQTAAAQVHDAYLAWARTTIPAPVAGFVARKNVALGQHVSAGTQVMAVIPLEQVWVDANFKENQMASMRVGQAATVTADLYGGKVEYHGKLVGFGAGTGGAFALLPAQNATGNWIKVVQRLPVRIALDPKELAAHPLQIGLSMRVDIDIQGAGGDRLPQLPRVTPGSETRVYGVDEDHANRRIEEVIALNGGKAVPGAKREAAVK
ncbi:MAG: efflux RND transporter periplasmic adaptor subunit [Rhodospirillales bacterium]